MTKKDIGELLGDLAKSTVLAFCLMMPIFGFITICSHLSPSDSELLTPLFEHQLVIVTYELDTARRQLKLKEYEDQTLERAVVEGAVTDLLVETAKWELFQAQTRKTLAEEYLLLANKKLELQRKLSIEQRLQLLQTFK